MKHTIDAQGKRIGRVASEASAFLMGKKSPSFKRNAALPVIVEIKNASQLFIESRKLRAKEYTRYSGYPGGLKKEALGNLIKRRGIGEALRRAIYGMLPSNKLRKERMKHLVIVE